MADLYLHSGLTSEIINAFYQVYNNLGFGFLEKVYHNSILYELNKRGLNTESFFSIDVFYENRKVGHYIADIIVENLIILEIKSVETLCEEHEAQLLNYLKATDIEIGLLLNFGKKPHFKRKIFSNGFKGKTTDH
jgi:GxxExxY protein